MYLKTVFIFCLVGFFNNTESKGLNETQIKYYQRLIYGNTDLEFIKGILKENGIKEIYNDYNNKDREAIRLYKLLKFLVNVEKCGDDEANVVKLDQDDFNIISTKFCELDEFNLGVIEISQRINLIDSYLSTILIRSTKKDEKVDENIDEEVDEKVDKKKIQIIISNLRYKYNNGAHYNDLGDVILKVLSAWKTHSKKTIEYGEIEDFPHNDHL
ncbi:uncharacterized protein LOC126905655 isoform X2 [Daktulosphaira vitifoliae]|nr:uncharacterized protein LOC126905655 isoform X2 [Daktulosphaira vitifoliae]